MVRRRNCRSASTAAKAPRIQAAPACWSNFEWAKVARKVVERWWRRHPANAATQLARPFLDRYAKEQPGKLVAIAASTGALIVLAKPWRLLSVTAVVAAVLKSSDVADMVTTLLQKNSHSRKDER